MIVINNKEAVVVGPTPIKCVEGLLFATSWGQFVFYNVGTFPGEDSVSLRIFKLGSFNRWTECSYKLGEDVSEVIAAMQKAHT